MLSRHAWFALTLSGLCLAQAACTGAIEVETDDSATSAELKKVGDIDPPATTPAAKASPGAIFDGPVWGPIKIAMPKRKIFKVLYSQECPAPTSGWTGMGKDGSGDLFPVTKKSKVVSGRVLQYTT